MLLPWKFPIGDCGQNFPVSSAIGYICIIIIRIMTYIQFFEKRILAHKTKTFYNVHSLLQKAHNDMHTYYPNTYDSVY